MNSKLINKADVDKPGYTVTKQRMILLAYTKLTSRNVCTIIENNFHFRVYVDLRNQGVTNAG